MMTRPCLEPRPLRRRLPGAFFVLFLPCLLLFLLGFSSAFAQGGTAAKKDTTLQIVRITPSGEDVPAGRQIVFEFNKPVVPLGRMERSAAEIPITFDPPLSCNWRWLTPSSLACRLNQKNATSPATRYRCSVGPGIAAEDGSTLSGGFSYTFVTERPKVAEVRTKSWLSPGTPQFTVRFNLPVETKSVAAHLYFRSASGERVPVEAAEDTETYEWEHLKKGTVWLVKPRVELAGGRDFDLMVEPGIVSTSGPEPGAENRQVNGFQTFPQFRFVGISCSDPANKRIFIRLEDPASDKQRCNPDREINMVFSAPVLVDGVREGLRITPDLMKGKPDDYDPWENVGSYSRLSDQRKKNQTYEVQLPELRPFAEYRIQAQSGGITDEFGRALARGFDVRLLTDHRPPDFTLYKSMPVLEKGLDTEAPALVTNLNQIDLSYDTLTVDGKTSQGTKSIPISKPQDSISVVPLGIRKLLPKASGVVKGQFTTRPPVSGKQTAERWFFAQVTPFAVHVKLGNQNTLVWITDLRSGDPVPGVDVQIYKDTFKAMTASPALMAQGATRDDGVIELAGTAVLDPGLELIEAYKPDSPHLFVRCRKGEDMAVLPLIFEFRVDAEGSNHDYIPSWQRARYGHTKAWGATAQGIYKVGDTVQFKIYVRDQDNIRFVSPPRSAYSLKVIDPMDKVVYERPGITLSDFGAFDGDFLIPKNGAVGWYRFTLRSSFTKEELEPMRVLVSDFTPSPFRVSTELSGSLFGPGDTVKVTTQAKLHAGGPYSNAAARVTALVEAKPFESQNPAARGFEFDVLGTSEHETPATETVYEIKGKLDDKGVMEGKFTVPETSILYGRMTVESSVRDDRGKSVANRASATYFGRDRYVGLLQKDWVFQEGKAAGTELLVVDEHGNPTAGTEIGIKVEWQETKASRVKGAGNAYLTQYVQEWIETNSLKMVSGQDPVHFEFTPAHAGAYRIVATISDTQGRSHETVVQRWVTGKGYVLWETVPGNLLNISPEKEEYGVGETARFLVQNPFPGARALVTVERFGVMQSWVRVLKSSTEIVEVPVLPDYLPGFYLSVVVMSPRVEKPLGPDGEDLGKPTFRMGYLKVEVKDRYKEIAVRAKPDKEVYKPGETVTVELEAQPGNLKKDENAPPVELAVTVLDEAVFDLLKQGRKAFDPYGGFYKLDELDLANYDLLMHLVGREKLEKKGATPGGGGGFDLGLRSVFKFVTYWNPSIRLNSEGKAKIQFQVPDNLTGWKVLAMAMTPDDLMGLGETTFRVNQSTEIRPALPNQVVEGDRFDAGFTIMNRTEATRTLEVSIEADGPVEKKDGAAPKIVQQITAEPFKRHTVRLPVKALGAGEIVFTARAGDAADQDGIRQKIRVLERLSPEVAAVYGSTTEDHVSQNLAIPQDIRPGTGSLSVTVSPTAAGNVEGAFAYMKDYPYSCWEQKITIGVMAAFYQKLKPYLGSTFTWDESNEIPKKMLALAVEYQASNGGMAFYVPKDENVSPYLSAFTALAFNWLKAYGYTVSGQVEGRLHEYLQSLLSKNNMPEFYSQGMASTVRAVALAALAEAGKLSAGDLNRYRDRVKEMSLFGKAEYLDALIHMHASPDLQHEAVRGILAYANETGGKLVFNESLDSGFLSLLCSPIRDNAAILSAFIAFRNANPNVSLLKDMPVRLMRTIMEDRKGRTGWASTQDNLFAVKSLVDFTQAYEAGKPDMVVMAFLDSLELGKTVFKDKTAGPVRFAHPLETADAGREAVVRLDRKGEGRLYFRTGLSYTPAVMKSEPTNAGIEVHREYSVERDGGRVLLGNPLEVGTGELVRVDLFVSVPAERYFVVLEDPVPGGLEPVDRGLATSSAVDAAKGEEVKSPEGSYLSRFRDWMDYGTSRWSFYHREFRHDAARFYSERLAPGRYHLSYAAQAIAPGEFIALPVRAEEMYDPDVFGKGIPETLIVKPAD